MLRVLVCTDETERSLRVLPHAAHLARAASGWLGLLEVLPQAGASAAAVTSAVQLLRDHLSQAGVQGDPVVVVRERGEGVPSAILRAAAAQSASVLAIDTRGHKTVHHLLEGSVAMELLGKGNLPVLTSGSHLETASAAEEFRIVATHDGSEASARVFQALAPLLSPGAFRVGLLSILQGKPKEPITEEGRRERLAELESLGRSLPAGVTTEAQVREIPVLGGVDSAILETAREWDAHAIAMTTRGTGAARHALLGSTALSVLGRSPVPLLLVPL